MVERQLELPPSRSSSKKVRFGASEGPSGLSRVQVKAEVHQPVSAQSPSGRAEYPLRDSSVSGKCSGGSGPSKPQRADCSPVANMASPPQASLMLMSVGLPQGMAKVACVDPCSTYNTLDIATFRAIGLDAKPPDQELEDLRSSGIFPCVYGVALLKVSLGGRKEGEGVFVIVDGDTRTCDLVLGEPFLTANGVGVNPHRKRLSLSGGDTTSVEIYLSGAPEDALPLYRGVPVRSEETAVIPSGETVMIRTSHDVGDLPLAQSNGVNNSQLMLVESVGAGRAHSKDLFVFTGLADVSSWGGQLAVINQGDTPITITTGQTVAHMSSVVEAVPYTVGHGINVVLPDPVVDREPVDEDPPEIGPNLSSSQRELVDALLLEHDGVFSKGETDMGCLGTEGHRIELYDDTPIYQKARRFPEVVNVEIEKQCHQLEALDIIEPSKSPFSSPVVPVRKKDGSIRLCVDYRRLNAATKPDKFPLPNLTDSVFGLQGTQFFTSLDLVRGYYQLPLDASCREYTAFSTPRAHWQFKRLSFGLKNAPAAFQRELQSILSRFPWQQVLVYIDDILILGRTFQEHLELVDKVLSTLAEHGLKVKLSKCQFFCHQVRFLGHIVSPEGLRKLQDYVDSVQTFPKPTTIKEMQRFLGLINFQRKFLENCAEIVKPLSQSTSGKKKGSKATSKKLVWTPLMETAFERVKALVAEDVLLSFPDYTEGSCPLELFTDASDSGVGACLMQRQGGEYKTIAYISTTFSGAQRKYDTTDKELTAIRWAVKTLRAFLYCVDFIIHSDHQPLVYLSNMRIVNARLARTLEDLAEFRFVIQYKPGRENLAADALSRMTPPMTTARLEGASAEPPAGLILLGEPIPGGGDSLILSLSRLLRCQDAAVLPRNPSELRHRLVDELQAHPQLYGLGSSTSLKRLKPMRGDGQLMSFEAVSAFASLTNCIIYVHYGLGIPLMVGPVAKVGLGQLPRLHLQCLAGVHFNPLEETPEYQAPVVDGSPERDSGFPTGAVSKAQEDVLMAQWRDTSCPDHTSHHLTTIMVRISGLELCCLVDSGAQCSCITSGAVHQLGLKPKDTRTPLLYGFGGGQGVATEGSVELELELSAGWSIRQKLTVVGSRMMPYCVILGVDALQQHRIQMDFAAGRMIQTAAVVSFRTARQSSAKDCQLAMIANSETVSPVVEEAYPPEVLDSPVGLNEVTLEYLDGLLKRDQLMTHQNRDRQLSTVRNAVARPVGSTSNRLSRLFSRHRKSLRVVDRVLYLVKGGKLVGVVSFPLMVEILLIFHLSLAHAGREKLLQAVSSYVWHPKMSSIAADITKTCHLCQTVKVSVDKAKAPTIKVQTQKPFDLVAVDLVALPASRRQICCLVAVDHNSKWLAVVPLTNKRAETVAEMLCDRIFPSLPRLPRRILSDNGPEFRGEAFKNRLESLGVEHVMTTPLNPASNGAVERGNRTLLELLRNLESTAADWSSNIPKAVMTYNHTMHRELGMSPSEYLLTQRHEPCGAPLIPLSETLFWKVGHPAFAPFKARQKVLRKVRFQGHRVENKLQERYEGPYAVKRINANEVTYVLEHCVTHKEVKEHHNHLKAYYAPPPYLQNCPYYRKMYATTESEGLSPSADAVVSDVRMGNACIGFGDTTTDSEATQLCEADRSSIDTSVDGKNAVVAPVAGREIAGSQPLNLFGAIGSAEQVLLRSWMSGDFSSQLNISGPPLVSEDGDELTNKSICSIDNSESLRASFGYLDTTFDSVGLSRCEDPDLGEDRQMSSPVELTLHLSTTLEHSDGHVQKIYSHVEPVPEESEYTRIAMGDVVTLERGTMNPQETNEQVITIGNTKVRLLDPKRRLESSPMRTRSRGRVHDYPNVQARPIEYSAKGSSLNTAVTEVGIP